MTKYNIDPKRPCAICGVLFSVSSNHIKLYCGPKCCKEAGKRQQLANAKEVSKACEHCSQPFVVMVDGKRASRPTRRFCSQQCKHSAMHERINQAKIAARGTAPASAKRAVSCSACGAKGHYQQTCQVRPKRVIREILRGG